MHDERLGRPDAGAPGYRRTLWLIIVATAAVASGEGAWARHIGSPDLFKDATGFGYDIALNVVAALVFGRGPRAERRSALAIAALLAASGVDALADVWADLRHPGPEGVGEVVASNLVSTGVALVSVLALLRFRDAANPLVKATWLNARNDAVATTLTAVLSVAARLLPVRWPETALDLIGVAFSFQAAYAVLRASRAAPDAGGPASDGTTAPERRGIE